MNTVSISDLRIPDFKNSLRDWVNQQPGSITAEEAAEFLGMSQDCVGTHLCLPIIGRALEALGCEKEVLTHYWPPAARPAQPPQPPQPQPADQVDQGDLQSTTNIIRDWVLNQTEPFTIADIYGLPRISEKLRCTKHSILLLDRALLTLGCTIDGGTTSIRNDSDLRYIPPNVKRVHREELYS